MTNQRRQARELQQHLLKLVDEGAIGFRAFLDSQSGFTERQTSAAQAAAVPLEIGRACREVAELRGSISPNAPASKQLHVGAAKHPAQAASRSSLHIAEHNLGLGDPDSRQMLQAEVRSPLAIFRNAGLRDLTNLPLGADIDHRPAEPGTR